MGDNLGEPGASHPHPYWSGQGTPYPAGGPQSHPQPQPVPPQEFQQVPPQPRQPRRSRRGLVALGLVAAMLVSGGIGGVIGAGIVGSGDGSDTGIAGIAEDVNPSQPSSPVADGTVEAVAEEVLPSVVSIEVAGQQAAGGGSGVVLSEDGLILTNAHVVALAAHQAGGQGGVQGQSAIRVQFSDGEVADAELVGLDVPTDVAVIRVDAPEPLAPISLGSSDTLNVGQSVIAIGSPLGLTGTVTTGIVSALDRPVRAGGADSDQSTVIDAIQTDAAVNPGNSGGALVNTNGDLVGINSAIASLGGAESGSIGLGFAIPVDQAQRVAEQLIATGSATQPILGVSVTDADTGAGALVADVPADGPAAGANIPEGAVITRVDDRRIDGGDSLVATIRSHMPGDQVSIEYARPNSTETETVQVTLGEAQ